MGFLLHRIVYFVHALRLFKALRLFFLTNFPGPTVIPCPTSIPDSRVGIKKWGHEGEGGCQKVGKTGDIIYGWPPENMDFLAPKVFLHNWFKILSE